jgi:penicillin-binding protein 2
MAVRTATDRETLRIRLLQAGMILSLALIAAMLWRIQVARGDEYRQDVTRQSIRRIRTPGVRGLVYDRHGAVLAGNRPKYNIAVFLEELRQPGARARTLDRVEALLDEMGRRLGRPAAIDREDIAIHFQRRLPLPILAWEDLDEEMLARWAEQAVGLPGIDLFVESAREYPLGRTACHVLGYVGRADPNEPEGEEFDYYLPDSEGKRGVEKTFDEDLRGRAGGELVRVDVTGYRYRDPTLDARRREARRGEDVYLALDADIQKHAEESLRGTSGAVVVMDPLNGDVLAMASEPGFDPNRFVPSISSAEWRALMDDALRPMLHRAMSGVYPPGSTFKPVVAMAALANGLSVPEQTWNCPGHFQLGRARFHCWYTAGHGRLDMRQSLQHSCNVYYYHLGLQVGPEAIAHMAEAMGFGARTGIDLDGEQAGLVPSPAWKRRRFGDAWRDGDTCNLSIGQGALLATPLQMAMITCALANGGTVFRPRIALGVGRPHTSAYREIPVKVLNELNWDPAHVRVIRGGMRDVVMSPNGTGRLARIGAVPVAGKTGTAEYGRKEDRLKRGWMIAFAPVDAPRVAVAMLIEEAVSGGTTAAPRLRRLLEGLFEAPAAEGRG